MSSLQLQNVQIPNLSFDLPSMKHLQRVIRGTADEEEEDDLIAAAAESQLKKERESESDFWKFLDYLTRPQHAIAGVLKDMVDGGDFSPLDRIGKALAGEEKYGIKDTLDLLFPGADPKLFKLPDWLGGKDVGGKDVVGFLGDVVSDPLMWLGFFRLGGQFAKYGAETASLAAKWVPVVDGAERARFLQIDKAMRANGVVHTFQAAFIRNRENMAFWNKLFKEAVDDPERFATRFLDEESAIQFMRDIEPYRKFKFPATTMEEQFKQRQRHLLSLRLPFAKKVGVPDISLLPFLDEHLGVAAARGIDEMIKWAGMNEHLYPIRRWLTGLFRYSSGIPAVDHVIMTVTANEAKRWEKEMQPLVSRFQNALRNNWTKEDAEKIVSYSLKRRENFGMTMRNIPEEYQGAVKALDDIYDYVLTNEKKRGLIDRVIEREYFVDSPEKAAEKFFTRLKYESERTRSGGAIYVPKHESWEEYVNQAQKEVREYLEKRKTDAIPEIEAVEKQMIHGLAKDILKADMEAAAKYLGDSLAITYDSYLPRVLTPKAQELFGTMLQSVKYKGQPAMEYFSRHFAGRKWNEVSMIEINRAMIEGKFPARFHEAVLKSYRDGLAAKSKKAKKNLVEFLREIGPEHTQFFIEDPVMQVAHRIRSSMRAITEHDRNFQILAITGRPYKLGEKLWLGERVYLPSPKGMEAILGRRWREKLSPIQLKAYDSIAKRYQLGSGSGVERLLVPLDNLGVVQGDLNKIPLFAYSDEVFDAIERYRKASTSKEDWGAFMKTFNSITQWWKATTLAIFPGYYARNTIGNFWQAFIGGTLYLPNYRDAMTVYRRSGEIGKPFARVFGKESLATPDRALEDVVIKAANGMKYTGRDILRIAENGDILGGGFYGEELGYMAKRGLTKKRKGAQKLIAIPEQFTQYGIPVKAGFAVGQSFENLQRLAHLIGRLRLGDTPYEAIRSVKKFFFDYRELTPFEKNTMRLLFPFYSWCVPVDTEILTEYGWKKYDEIHIGEKALTINPKTRRLEWQPIEDINVFPYMGELMSLSLKKNGMEILFTPGHRWLVSDQNNQYKIVRGYELRSNHKIPLTGEYEKEKSIIDERLAAIIGWVVTDGYIRWKGNCPEIIIYQSPKKYLKEIMQLVGDDGIAGKPHPDTNVVPVRLNRALAGRITKYIRNKDDIESLVPKLGHKECKAMWESMLKAEGHVCIRKKGGKQIQFAQNEGGVLNAFQTLTILIGKAGQITGKNKIRHIYVKTFKNLKISSSGPDIKNYYGLVWCPTTRNGTWLMRRNGFAMFTGNSRKNIPLQLEMLIRQPGKYAQLKRAIDFIQSDEAKQFDRKLLPRWVSKNFGVPLRINKYTGDVEVSILKYWIPAAELVDYVHPSPHEVAMGTFGQGMSMLNPLPKTLLELGTGLSFYTKREIEEFPEEGTMFLGHPMRKRLVHALKNFRVLSELNRLAYGKTPQGELEFSTRLWNALGIAPKIRAFDVEDLQNRWKFDTIQRKAQLKRMLSRAKRRKQADLVAYLKDLIENAGS